MSYTAYAREYFFPSGCGVCGEDLVSPQDAWYGLCADCRSYLSGAFTAGKHCEACGRPLISERGTCIPCRQNLTGANALSGDHRIKLKAIFPYSGKFRAVLASYKFAKYTALGNFFARVLVSAINGLIGDIDSRAVSKAAWVPVPPRPGKKKTQGWDQVEYLARLLEKEHKRLSGKEGSLEPLASDHSGSLSLPVCRCLKRLSTRSQKELNRQDRGKNLKGRILCVKPPPQTVILFDDVITTGSTLKACAEVLLEKGAARVYGLCLFYD